LFNLQITNYTSLIILICLIIILWSKFHAKEDIKLYSLKKIISYGKDMNPIYIFLIVVLLIITLAYSAHIWNELYINIDYYVHIYMHNNIR
jgi:hypothetical protein